MDTPLDPTVLRRNTIRRVAAPVVIVAGLATTLLLLPGWMTPSVARARIRTARVVRGPIEAVITASGLVVPEIERVLSSPLDARVTRILKRPGAALAEGDPVVALDVSASVLALQKVVTEQQIKDNQQAQTRLALEKSVADLDGRIEVKTLQLQSAQAKSRSNQQLFSQGLLSRDALEQSGLTVRQDEIELAQLRQERTNAERATVLQSDGLALERSALDREATEARHLLDLATTKSDRDGVLTWVFEQEGGVVRKGDVIARIADLRSFRVDATVSDVHAGRLRAGTPVIVKAGEVSLEGAVAGVLPTIEDGIVRFTVSLRERSNAVLRPNLRVDVLVITERKPQALSVVRGPFADGSGSRDAFVIHGNRGVKTAIELGMIGFSEVEVVAGLEEGDEVVVSDMRDYLHLKEVTLK